MRRFWPPLLMLLLVCGLAASAHADPTAPTDTTWSSLSAGDDWSATLLDSIFPAAATQGTSSIGAERTVIGLMLGQLTGYVMALAAAFVAYTTIIQITRAAETGRVLSDSTSSWAPVRLFFAIMLMFPVSSGFSVGQMAVVQVAKWGIGMGRSVYTNAIQAVGPDAIPIAQPMIPGTRAIVAGLMQNEMCRALINITSGNPNMVPIPVAVKGGTAGMGGYVTWSYGLGVGNETGTPVCGTVTVKVPSTGTNLAGVNVDMTGTQQATLIYVLDEIRADATLVAANLYTTRDSAALNPLMQTYVQATYDYTQMLTQASTDITTSLNTAFKDASTARNGAIGLANGQSQMAALGWTSAAAYYLEISRLNGQTLSLLSATPLVSPPSYQGLGEGLTKDLVDLLNPILAFQAKLNTYVQTQDTRSAPAGNGDLIEGAQPSQDGAGTIEQIARHVGFNEAFLKKLMDYTQSGGNQWTNPILSMIGLGHLMINTSITALGLSALLSSTVATTGLTAAQIVTFNFSGAAATAIGHVVVTFLATPIFYGCMALLIPGLILAFVLPMIPYLMWIAGVAGWLILVVEAVVAVPLWAFAHLTWQGDGLHGRGTHGYSILFNILFRPTLMLFGLFMGYFIYSSVSSLTLKGFGVAAGFALQNGWFFSNLLGVVTLLCLFVLLQLTVALLSFRLISGFPNQIVKWSGMNAANRVDMDRFASEAGIAGMGASLRGIQGGTGAMMQQAIKSGGEGGGEGGGGSGGGGGGGVTRAIAAENQGGGATHRGRGATDSTLQAATDVTRPAEEKKR